ncbi:MAG: acetolactate synthase large subunit [Desulfoferrobacter sp.]
MTGAELLVNTAAELEVDICFANPGTTEMPIVEALDKQKRIRSILGLFEGVCTGAADGYGRMAGKPAMVLLHLGPGLANGLANLHNARRAHSPLFNVIGQHATWHLPADPLLAMDVEALAGTVSEWQRTNKTIETLSRDTVDAVAAALQGKVSTLIVPHDHQIAPVNHIAFEESADSLEYLDQDSVESAARLLHKSGHKTAVILGGRASRRRGLMIMARVSAATGCSLFVETFPSRVERGAGLPLVERIPYFPNQAVSALAGYESIIFAGTREPVAFFGYPGQPSYFLNDQQAKVHIKASPNRMEDALEALADSLTASKKAPNAAGKLVQLKRPELPEGNLTPQKASAVLAALQPEGAIVVEEAITSAGDYFHLSTSAPPHTYLALTGGAIGQGIPCALGASLACPDRPVINLQADGSAMYTVQALWSQAREAANVKTLICSNRSYAILRLELARAGKKSPGNHALSLTDLSNPELNWVELSRGLGVPAARIDKAEDLAQTLGRALTEPGPYLIEMVFS